MRMEGRLTWYFVRETEGARRGSEDILCTALPAVSTALPARSLPPSFRPSSPALFLCDAASYKFSLAGSLLSPSLPLSLLSLPRSFSQDVGDDSPPLVK